MHDNQEVDSNRYRNSLNSVNAGDVAPHDFEAEQSVLGSLMLESEDVPLWDRIAVLLSDTDFFEPRHQAIFRSCARLHKQDKLCDIITLSADLRENNELDIIGGQSYLIELSHITPSTSSIEVYAKIVRDNSLKRKLLALCSDAIVSIRSGTGQSIDDQFEHIQQNFLRLSQENTDEDNGPQALGSLLGPVLTKIKSNIENNGGVTGVSSGYVQLDNMTAGFHGGELIIVAARPAMGKTTFAMNLVQHAFMNPSVQYPAVVFSLEMPSWQLMIRLISAIGRVEMDKLNKGNINDEDMMRITSAFNLLNQRGKFLYVDDRGGLTPMQISAEIRKIYREHGGVSMVMIDYLQLMKFPGYENDKQHEISEISGALKRIAKEFDVPVIALSQLNRGLEQRTEKRPMNSDLRESGAIEQDADVIMFIYRDEVYHPDSKDKGLAEVIIGKQRNGPIGTVRLIFEGQYSSFMNYNGMYDQEDVLQ